MHCLRFDGLDPNTMYTIHIATELEGKTVVQVFMVHSLSRDQALLGSLPSYDVVDSSVSSAHIGQCSGEARVPGETGWRK